MDILPQPKHSIILDSQVLTALMGCPCYADFRFNHDLTPIGGKNNGLECGSIVHVVLENFYKSRIGGYARNDAIDLGLNAGRKYIREGDDGNGLQNTPAESTKSPHAKIGYNYVLQTCIEYFDFYKNDSWTPLFTELVKGELIYEDEEIRIMWKAKLDLGVDTNAGILPVDHKSMSQNRSTTNLNNQFKGQCILMKSRNVIINKVGFQSSLKPHEKFIRETKSYSLAILTEWSQVIVPYAAKQMLNYAESGYWPRSGHGNQCENKYGFCSFYKICESDPSMREHELRMHFVKSKKWDIANVTGDAE